MVIRSKDKILFVHSLSMFQSIDFHIVNMDET